MEIGPRSKDLGVCEVVYEWIEKLRGRWVEPRLYASSEEGR